MQRQMRELLIRLIYCEMLGVECSWGYIHAIKMTQSGNIMDKRTGMFLISWYWNRGIQRCPHFRVLSSTVYRGVLISGCWNRGVPLYTEVSSFQGVGIEAFHYNIEVSSLQGSTVYRDVLISGSWLHISVYMFVFYRVFSYFFISPRES